MRQIVFALVLVGFAVPTLSGNGAVSHGGQPVAFGAIPMTDVALVTGDYDPFIRR